MNVQELMQQENIDFSNTDANMFLLGLLSAFDNRYQAKADSLKQFFEIICIDLCKESPTINELAQIMGSSHQNVKQILLKLEKKGFIDIVTDGQDKRKQRIILTDKTRLFCEEHEAGSRDVVSAIFNGISSEHIQITIRTIMQMESNLNKI